MRFVASGLDSQGVAYLLLEEYAFAGGARAYVVARREPATTNWTFETLVPASDSATIHPLAFVVAGNGHAFIRYERDLVGTLTTHTLHRAPADAQFTPTAAYDGVTLDAHTAFPGGSGRACSVVTASGPGPLDGLDSLRCVGGGSASVEHPIGGVRTSSEYVAKLESNEHGDAVIKADSQIYLFDGAMEVISSGTPLNEGSFHVSAAVAIGPSGDVCFGYRFIDIESGLSELRRIRRSPGQPFTTPEPIPTEPNGNTRNPISAAVDSAGHCFIALSELRVIHDAAGGWSIAYAPPSFATGALQTPAVFAGAANQAFVAVGSLQDGLLYRYAPIVP